jgi:hypothetical protein
MSEEKIKIYLGVRSPTLGGIVTVSAPGHNGYSLPLRLDLANHSPTGFEWGYCGSGPAQLALALLADCLDDAQALAFYQDFKASVVARLPENWSLTSPEIVRHVDRLLVERDLPELRA